MFVLLECWSFFESCFLHFRNVGCSASQTECWVSIAFLSHTRECCTTRCCLTSDPRQNWPRRHQTRRSMRNLRLGYAPKSSFRSSWILFTGKILPVSYMLLSKNLDCLNSILTDSERILQGSQSVANLSTKESLSQRLGWYLQLASKTPQIGLDLFVLQLWSASFFYYTWKRVRKIAQCVSVMLSFMGPLFECQNNLSKN